MARGRGGKTIFENAYDRKVFIKRLSKAGNRYLRKCLFFPAMTAIRYNPDF